VTRNLFNLVIWYALFLAVAYVWTLSLPVAAIAALVGIIVVAALGLRGAPTNAD